MAQHPERPRRLEIVLLCLLLILPVHHLRANALGPAAAGASAVDASVQVARWTILVYLDGDNNLEQEAVEDFLEIATVGSNDDVQVVVQFDRAPGYDRRYGDWTGTLRFHVTQGMTPEPANALADLGEANMGHKQTLVDFVRWGKANYPAQRTTLVLWNHGDGWRANSIVQDTRKSVCWDETELDALNLDELRDALSQMTQAGAQPLDLLAFDACLMAMIEVDTQMRPFVRVRVASEETEPSTGYPYQDILTDLRANPGWGPVELSNAIVTRYYDTYHGETMSAIALDASHAALVSAIDGLARALLNHRAEYPSVGQARLKSQTFQGEFVDLYDLAERIGANAVEPEVQLAARAVLDAHQQTVILEQHGPYWPGAHGTSIYFPAHLGGWDPQYAGERDYLLFTAQTQWDEFLISYLNRNEQPVVALSGAVTLQGRLRFQGTQITAQPFASPLAPGATTTAEDRTLGLSAAQPFASPIAPSATTTAEDGTFELSAVQPCTVTARHAGFLSALWVVDQPGVSQVTLPAVTLLGGDMNGDERINILDIAYIGARMEGQDALADLNQDGKVNILDLVLAASNFGRTSEP